MCIGTRVLETRVPRGIFIHIIESKVELEILKLEMLVFYFLLQLVK